MDIRYLIASREHPNAPILGTGLWYAEVVEPVPVFPNGSAALFFIIPDVDINTKWKTYNWSLKVDDQLIDLAEGPETQRLTHLAVPVWPVKGSTAIIAFDNREQIWVLAWR